MTNTKSNISETNTINSLNLGGWLVLEKWMTPSVFNNTNANNEFELSKTKIGQENIIKHRNNFITEKDFIWLKNNNIDIIRLPIGYWSIEDSRTYISAIKNLEWAMKMFEKYEIKVLLCLHAAPGSQNNSDHSGNGKPGPIYWYKKQNRQKTTKVLEKLAQKYKDSPSLWGIEILNEPTIQNIYQGLLLWRWNSKTIKKLERILPKNIQIICSDSFMPKIWRFLSKRAVLDIHHYQCFSKFHHKADFNDQICSTKKSNKLYKRIAKNRKLIIGEWSATLPPKTAKQKNVMPYIKAQIPIHKYLLANFYWTYKTESKDTWNFKHLKESGYF